MSIITAIVIQKLHPISDLFHFFLLFFCCSWSTQLTSSHKITKRDQTREEKNPHTKMKRDALIYYLVIWVLWNIDFTNISVSESQNERVKIKKNTNENMCSSNFQLTAFCTSSYFRIYSFHAIPFLLLLFRPGVYNILFL